MEAYYNYLNDLLSRNKREFPGISPEKWVNPYNVPHLREKRERLLGSPVLTKMYGGTKPYHHSISEGCRLCAEGLWSCLFITGKCNASCFYCPASQLQDEVPESQGIKFETPASYSAYIRKFGFKGVSFSGGEPFLYFDRVCAYLEEVRKNCDPGIYTWMYTNGILGDQEKFEKLARLGLNEIRFDIGAVNYSLDRIKEAKDIIEVISIEIPAIPEEKDRIISLLPEMVEAGVQNLNLHQLRLTHHNEKKLLKKPYHYVAAEKPVVLESEIAALEIIESARESGLQAGINYCSFDYKNRFQKPGFRRQVSKQAWSDSNQVTRNGYIRLLTGNKIQYEYFRLLTARGGESGTDQEKEMEYEFQKNTILSELCLDDSQVKILDGFIGSENPAIPQDELLFRIWQMEHIEENLREV